MTAPPAMRAIPRTATQPLTYADIIQLQTLAITHQALDCGQEPGCPVERLSEFLEGLAEQFRQLGTDRTRAQLWASLHTLTA